MQVTCGTSVTSLGPICTILGLAFRLHATPEGLLGQVETRHHLRWCHEPSPGVPDRAPLPLNAVFQNGPNWGKDVSCP